MNPFDRDPFEETAEPRQGGVAMLPRYVKTMQRVWLFLLFPWVMFALLSGMAFDGGTTISAYTFVWAVCTYPLTLLIASVSKRWVPQVIFLPLANVLVALFAG